MKDLTAVSMFAGIGGICLRFIQVDWQAIWANETNKVVCNTYWHNLRGDYLHERDIKHMSHLEIPSMDILTAQLPCRSVSICWNAKRI